MVKYYREFTMGMWKVYRVNFGQDTVKTQVNGEWVKADLTCEQIKEELRIGKLFCL